MKLTDFDLKQMDESYLTTRTLEQAIRLLLTTVADLKEARDRLNRTPANSSRPPSSQAPWDKPGVQHEDSEDLEPPHTGKQDNKAVDEEAAPEDPSPQDQPNSEAKVLPEPPKRPPGKQPGAQGYGRTQYIEPNQHCMHQAPCCAACAAPWTEHTQAKAYTAYDEIDLALPVPGTFSLKLTCTRHTLLVMTWSCGHQTRAQPYRAESNGL